MTTAPLHTATHTHRGHGGRQDEYFGPSLKKNKIEHTKLKKSACMLQPSIYDAAYKRFANSSGKGSSNIQAKYPRGRKAF